MKDLAIEIAKARASRELTPAELAEKAGISPITMNALEGDNHHAVTIDDLVNVAIALDLTVHVSFRRAEDDDYDEDYGAMTVPVRVPGANQEPKK